MESNILDLVRNWQNKGSWQATYELFADWRKTRENVNRQHGLREFAIQKENAENLHGAYLDAIRELGEIRGYLQDNAPLLLEDLPIVDWETAPADYRPLIASMLKIEGRLLATIADTGDGGEPTGKYDLPYRAWLKARKENPLLKAPEFCREWNKKQATTSTQIQPAAFRAHCSRVKPKRTRRRAQNKSSR